MNRWRKRPAARTAWSRCALSVVVLSGAVACSDLAPGSDTCASLGLCGSEDSGEPEPELPENFRCYLEDPPPAQKEAIGYTMIVRDWTAQGSPIPGLTASICAGGIVSCKEPAAVIPGNVPNPADIKGLAVVPIPRGFPGYLALQASTESMDEESEANGFVPTAIAFGRTPSEDRQANPFLMIRKGDLAQLAEDINPPEPFDTEKTGIIIVRIADCNNQPAEGLELTLNKASAEGAIAYRFISRGVLPVLEDDGIARTGRDGSAAYTNVRPGITTVRATLPNGLELPGEWGFLVQAGWNTFLEVYPK